MVYYPDPSWRPRSPPSQPRPFNGDQVSERPSLIPKLGVWPSRLLHVKTMTSHARSGYNTYDGVQAPRYNIMSYTWGHYEDYSRNGPSLPVLVVNWPIPCIKKEHFTTEMFLDAIRRVARGADKKKCDWVWVDVACIPQAWAGETCEDAALRGQEIGRQVEIFQMAEEFFAWLSSVQEADIVKDHQDLVRGRVFALYLTAQDVLHAINQLRFVSGELQGLDEFEAMTLAYEKYMKRILGHPWFQSLWTLQEMVLRSNDGFILLDDSGLSEGVPKKGVSGRHISLSGLTNETGDMEDFVLPGLQTILRAMAATHHPHDITSSPHHGQFALERILRRLENLTSLQKSRGLIGASVTVPHTVYSAAAVRSVTRLVDRIYGIVQVYGISCNPDPKGNDQLAKLHALEDEFGWKLVQKAPVLSQFFLHSSVDETPRRSWLITQNCDAKLMGEKRDQFDARTEIRALFEVFRVLPGPRGFDAGDLLLSFGGKAWSLAAFTEASVARGDKPTLFLDVDVSSASAWSTSGAFLEDEYGLKLDHHISKAIFGHVVSNFPADAGMHDAIHRVFQYYSRPYISGREGLGTVAVALLGSYRKNYESIVDYIGLVLVCRDSGENTVGCHANGEASFPAAREIHSAGIWERIGLMIWCESFFPHSYTPCELLPPPYVLHCSIV